MDLAHSIVRDDVADAARRGRVRRYSVAFEHALASVWSTAQTRRWFCQCDAAAAALPASHAAILAERTAGKAVSVDLAAELGYARATLEIPAEIRGSKRRATEFRAEHGIETMNGLWSAFVDHAALLGRSAERRHAGRSRVPRRGRLLGPSPPSPTASP